LKINHQLSQRIELLRFVLIIGIVFIHIHTGDIQFSSTILMGNVYAILVEYLSEGLARVSVPLFFALSGYLYFFNFKASFDNFIKKFKSRFRTLFMPFIIWNMLIFIFFAIAQNTPIIEHYFTGDRPLVLSLDGFESIALFFGFDGFEYPVAYQFWFIRDLIILVVLTPLIYLFLLKIPYIFLLGLSVMWFFDLNYLEIVRIDPVSPFFFTLGAYLGMKKYDFSNTDDYALQILLLYFLISVLDLFTDLLAIHHVAIFLGTLAIFSVTKYLITMSRIKIYLLSLAKYSFFVYAAHEPFLSIIRKLTFKMVDPQSDLTVFIIYLFCPVITIIICIQLYKILEKTVPKMLNIAIGGRN
jgi:surface polysaccharide O-acyltransferase-like enzyme